MQKIALLSDHTINQIAAGEVVADPASAIKELVENSIDAGATSIRVSIKGGGLQLIRVVDNGKGIPKEELPLAILRHATSKLSDITDLDQLLSMGFRGEALASICSVSRTTIASSAGETGHEVEIERGHIVSSKPCARGKGTTIEVHSMFFNVPARLKFQPSPSSSVARIKRLMHSLALAHREVAFTFESEEQILFKTEGNESLEERAAHVFESGQVRNFFSCNQGSDGYHIEALFGAPHAAKSSRTGQHIFVNRRPIESSMISYAIKNGYGTQLQTDKHPIFVLHLTIPPSEVDVNVHPQKSEVRFRNDAHVRKLLSDAVIKTLNFTPELEPIEIKAFDSPFFFERKKDSTPWTSFGEPSHFEEKLEEKIVFSPPKYEPTFSPVLCISHFLIVREGGKLLSVDLQAANRRLFTEKEEKISSQYFLLPLGATFDAHAFSLLQEKKALLSDLGFVLHESGENAFLIEAAPAFLQPQEAKEALEKVADAIAGGGSISIADLSLKCLSARYHPFSEIEGMCVLRELMAKKLPLICPKGKPIIVEINEDVLHKIFSSSKCVATLHYAD